MIFGVPHVSPRLRFFWCRSAHLWFLWLDGVWSVYTHKVHAWPCTSIQITKPGGQLTPKMATNLAPLQQNHPPQTHLATLPWPKTWYHTGNSQGRVKEEQESELHTKVMITKHNRWTKIRNLYCSPIQPISSLLLKFSTPCPLLSSILSRAQSNALTKELIISWSIGGWSLGGCAKLCHWSGHAGSRASNTGPVIPDPLQKGHSMFGACATWARLTIPVLCLSSWD